MRRTFVVASEDFDCGRLIKSRVRRLGGSIGRDRVLARDSFEQLEGIKVFERLLRLADGSLMRFLVLDDCSKDAIGTVTDFEGLENIPSCSARWRYHVGSNRAERLKIVTSVESFLDVLKGSFVRHLVLKDRSKNIVVVAPKFESIPSTFATSRRGGDG